MDVQQGIVERIEGSSSLLATLDKAMTAARGAEVAVIFVRVAFRAGAPEISGRNRTFSALAGSEGMALESPATQIHPAVGPQRDEAVVIKKRVSAFAGSDLKLLLRSLEVRHLVLTGIATSGVVLSTLREGADLDYELTVLSDACFDPDDEVHRVLLEKVFPRQAAVLTTDEWIEGLRVRTSANR